MSDRSDERWPDASASHPSYDGGPRASVELDAGPFGDGFHHVDGWVPQRLVTATGPNPLPTG